VELKSSPGGCGSPLGEGSRHDVPVTSFYVSDGPDRYLSQPSTAGPWTAEAQHGGPPAALLTRAIERLARDEDRVVGRFTMELLGPVPVGPLRLTAEVVRPGRSVEMCEATLYDEQRERPCARAVAWLFPAGVDGPNQEDAPLLHTPQDGTLHERQRSWSGGYLDAVDWRWIEGAVETPGPAVVWMRPTVDLVPDEPMSPVQRLMACVDSASGVSAALDPVAWGFLNTELTVHVLRAPVGEWLCLEAETLLGSGSVGIATSRAYDAQGLVARSSQALLIAKR
jgi:hypothetical protein